jgi:hypothetical protein
MQASVIDYESAQAAKTVKDYCAARPAHNRDGGDRWELGIRMPAAALAAKRASGNVIQRALACVVLRCLAAMHLDNGARIGSPMPMPLGLVV